MEHKGRAERNRQYLQSNRVVKPDSDMYFDGRNYNKHIAN